MDGAIKRLRDQIVEFIDSELEWMPDDPRYCPGDSPIEKVLALALIMRSRMNMCEYTGVLVLDRNEDFAPVQDLIDNEPGFRDRRTTFILRPQVQLDGWRVDFIASVYNWRDADPSKHKWMHLIIECDGHNFHERTKEQAARDRARDRAATLSEMPVMRFTGSEIYRDPMGCAEQIMDYTLKGWG